VGLYGINISIIYYRGETMEEQVIENKDQKWFLSGLYFLEAMKEEQEETKQYVQYNYRKEGYAN
jgi:hypothetical protein|tara:strand:- start:594 stop:785 length:192 start_codon:yes stop_codon:yes gene_type:complete